MADYIGKVCPFCKTPFQEGDDVVICSVCEMPHHKECWVENQGCTTFGCTGTIQGLNQPQMPPQGYRPAPPAYQQPPQGYRPAPPAYQQPPQGYRPAPPAYPQQPAPQPVRRIFCPACGNPAQSNQRFCAKCGGKLPTVGSNGKIL